MYLIGTETGSKHACSSFDKQTPRQVVSKCMRCGCIPCQCSSSSDSGYASSGGWLIFLLPSCVDSDNCLKN